MSITNSKPLKFLKNSLLLWLMIGVFACNQNAAPEVRMEGRTTAQGRQYSVFHPQGLAIRVVTSRPQTADSRCQLSVAGAYTDLDTNLPLDLLVCQGCVLQATAKVGFLDGMLMLVGDSLEIGQIPKGQSPPGALVERVRSRQGTLLLQELLVFRGQNVRPEGGSLFQRRALAELKNHRFAVVESVGDGLTMKQFAADLIELGAQNALYLDMGDWDEGWYKAGSQVVKLGNRRTETARQSNWLVFEQPVAAQ